LFLRLNFPNVGAVHHEVLRGSAAYLDMRLTKSNLKLDGSGIIGLRPTIFHVIENLDDTYGGPSRSVPNLAASTIRLGGEARLLSVEWHAAEHNDVVQREQLSWKNYPLLGPRKVCFSPRLIQALNAQIPSRDSVIHLHTLWNSVAVASFWAARKNKIPLVVSPRGALYSWSLAQGRIRKSLAWQVFLKRALQRAALIHVTEPNEARAVRELGISAPLIIVPNGVEQIPSALLRGWFSLRSARLEAPLRYLFLSRIHKKKGVDVLLKAWARSVARTRGGQLDIAGPFATPAYEREICLLVDTLGVKDSVRFLGMLTGEDRERAFLGADVFVLPSHTENFGVAIVEALARGLPVITTKGTPWRSISENDAGWWLELSEDMLRSTLDEASELSRAALLAMGERAVSLARNFAWERQAQELLAAYNWVLGGPKPVGLIQEASECRIA
jgi:glycosyltransferase involved in cell wall biosynthesis